MASTTTYTVPQHPGEFTPEEAIAWAEAQINETNEAGDEVKAAKALKLAQGVVVGWEEALGGLKRRWRATYHMLSGNTLEKGGPEDVHVPEIYKAAETLVPRVEEAILEREPWFRVVPRQRRSRDQAATNAAYIDWQFQQAKVRSLIQPAIRDTLFTQAAAFHVWWDNQETERNQRTIERKFTDKGRLERKIRVQKKKVIDYSGPRVKLVDPFDFIIDTKATNPQDATYVGHRAYLTMDQVLTLGKQRGWKNMETLDRLGPSGTLTATQDFYKWPRDPASRYKTRQDGTEPEMDGRPGKVEVVFLYTRATWDEGRTYDDYLIVVVAAKTVVEVRVNPNDGKYRPYATIRSSKSGHEFYSIGTFDNAVRLNQHLDAYHQLFLRGAKLAGSPMGFAEDDSDLPDTLYQIRPGKILKGVGNVRFTQIPDGFLRAAPLVVGMLQKNIEETVGAFRINMGQDTGGTATEASLSLQEGNRRTRGLIRAVGDGLEQLLHLFHKMNLQFSVEDVEFPVMGKRALEMRKTHINMTPADLLDDVEFELVGLNSTRTYGLKATGFQAIFNTATPLIQAHANNVDTLQMLHDMFDEFVGPSEADRYVKIPTSPQDLKPQTEENEGLLNGAEIEVDQDDNHEQHLRDLLPLYREAANPESKMHFEVRRVVAKHWHDHMTQLQRQNVMKEVMDRRNASRQAIAGSEAGRNVSPETGRASPAVGGMESALDEVSTGPPGQAQNENPGPADSRKSSRAGRKRQTVNQSENTL